MFRHFKSLRKELMVAVLGLLSIPMVIVIAIAQAKSQSVIRAQSLALNTNLLQIGVGQLESSWSGLNNIYQSVYLNESFQEYLRLIAHGEHASPTELLKKVFLSSLSSRSDLYSILYIDNDGRLTYATREEAGTYASYEDCQLPDAYVSCIQPDADWSSGAVLLSTSPHMPLQRVKSSPSRYVYAAARQIVNIESHFEPVGVMFITLDLTGLEQLAGLIRPDASAITYFCDDVGNVAYDSSGACTAGMLSAEFMAFKDGKVEHETSWNGQRYMMVSVRSEETGWTVLTVIPEAVYSADAMSVTTAMMLAVLVALAVIAIITAIVSKKISKPVEQLADTMDATQLRRLDQRVEISGEDEIARLGISFNTLMDKLNTAIENEYEMEIQQKNAEIRALQAQMNPHFLYNVLQSISSMASLRRAPEISTMANALGGVLRYSISSKPPLATLREEMAHTENYLTIQKIRFGERLRYEICVPEYVMDCKIPRVSLQPMVENAILHGFEQRQEVGTIYIQGWLDGGMLNLEVTDDGQGIPPERLDELRAALRHTAQEQTAHGIGLSNLNARLRLLYGEKGRLELDSEQNIGTAVRIVVPVKEGVGHASYSGG